MTEPSLPRVRLRFYIGDKKDEPWEEEAPAWFAAHPAEKPELYDKFSPSRYVKNYYPLFSVKGPHIFDFSSGQLRTTCTRRKMQAHAPRLFPLLQRWNSGSGANLVSSTRNEPFRPQSLGGISWKSAKTVEEYCVIPLCSALLWLPHLSRI